MALADFVNQYNGHANAGTNAADSGQCVGLVHLYQQFLGIPLNYGNAKDMFDTAPDAYYTKVANSPSGVPPAGSIIVWNAFPGDPYGHIGVALAGANTNAFTSFDQNWPLGSAPHAQSHNYNYVRGWLIPKPVAAPTPPTAPNIPIPPAGQGTAVDVLNVRNKPDNTNGTIIRQIPKGTTFVLKSYTHGSMVAGQWGNTDIWDNVGDGYVSDGYVFTGTNAPTVPLETPPAPAPTPAPPAPVYTTRPDGTGSWGVDVSSNNGSIDFTKLKSAGVDFVIIRAGHVGATYGGDANMSDPQLLNYLASARSAGLAVHYYFYGFLGLDPLQEAEYFYNELKDHIQDGESIWLDLEDTQAGVDPAKWAGSFLIQAEQLFKQTCHLYTYDNYAQTNPNLKTLLTTRKLWKANYNGTPDDMASSIGTAIIHQYADNGNFAGIVHPLDLNWTALSVNDLKALAVKSSTPEPLPTPTPTPVPTPVPTPTPTTSSLFDFFSKIVTAIVEWLKSFKKQG